MSFINLTPQTIDWDALIKTTARELHALTSFKDDLDQMPEAMRRVQYERACRLVKAQYRHFINVPITGHGGIDAAEPLTVILASWGLAEGNATGEIPGTGEALGIDDYN